MPTLYRYHSHENTIPFIKNVLTFYYYIYVSHCKGSTIDLINKENIIAILQMYQKLTIYITKTIIFIIMGCTNILVILENIFQLISFYLLILRNAVGMIKWPTGWFCTDAFTDGIYPYTDTEDKNRPNFI